MYKWIQNKWIQDVSSRLLAVFSGLLSVDGMYGVTQCDDM
jgi:hypothetical protein